MDLNEAEDRISGLPDSLIHHILSFLVRDVKLVARTCLLSKRWNYLWTSIPTLVFRPWVLHSSLSEINNFSDFLDRTLLLRDPSSSIQKFSLFTHKHMNPSQVHSWISSITNRNVQELRLYLNPGDKPFFIPMSLFTCHSLIKLEIGESDATRLPKRFSFPNLKSLTLSRVRFTDDCSWTEQHFSSCPVLEDLVLFDCTWSEVKDFCISIPTLKLLEIDNDRADDHSLQDCALKILAPDLVSLVYCGCVAKEFFFSSFPRLKFAKVFLVPKYGLPREQNIGYGAVVSKFIQTLSQVQSLEIYAEALETLSIVYEFVEILPTFHNLYKLILKGGATTDKTLFPLLKAVPNLRCLEFEEGSMDDNEGEQHSWDGHLLTAGCMFRHLESVTFVFFSGNARQMRWVKLILECAVALKTFECFLCIDDDDTSAELLMEELLNLTRASGRCEFEFEE